MFNTELNDKTYENESNSGKFKILDNFSDDTTDEATLRLRKYRMLEEKLQKVLQKQRELKARAKFQIVETQPIPEISSKEDDFNQDLSEDAYHIKRRQKIEEELSRKFVFNSAYLKNYQINS